MPLPFMGQDRKTIEELEEIDQEESLKLSIAQKKALQEKLKANGLKVSSFGSLQRAWDWFKKH
jgi:hypothetical protein